MRRRIKLWSDRTAYALSLMLEPLIFGSIIAIVIAIIARGIIEQIYYPNTEDIELPPIFDYFSIFAIGIPFIILLYFRIKREVRAIKHNKEIGQIEN